MGMTYEEKMRLLQYVKPENKDELLLRIARGETVDITKDEDLFYQINVDRMSIEDAMNRDKYKPLAEDMKEVRKHLHDPLYGKTRGGVTKRYLGEIPDHIYFTHPWFSPHLSKEERSANIKKFLNMFPMFRAGSKPI